MKTASELLAKDAPMVKVTVRVPPYYVERLTTDLSAEDLSASLRIAIGLGIERLDKINRKQRKRRHK